MKKIVVIRTSFGEIKYLLDTKAIKGTEAFISLAKKGILDDHKIMRVVKDFVIQPVYDEEKEVKEYAYTIAGEYKNNNFFNRDMQIYDLCLAGDGKKISSPACYFICLSSEAAKKLNQRFTVIGSLINGEEVINKIAKAKTVKVDIGVKDVVVEEPIDDIRINSVSII